MSMRDFLEGECGQNPVLKVASHFTRDTLGASTSTQFDPSRQDVSLLPPTTFQMDDLLREIQSMGSHAHQPPIQAPGIAELAMRPEWAQEFMKHEQHSREPETQESWIRDYMSKELELDSVWEQEVHFRNGGGMHHPHPQGFHLHAHPLHHPHLGDPAFFHGAEGSAKELLDDSKWAEEYEYNHNPASASDAHHLERTELMATAEEFLKSVADPKIKATEFMSYVEKLSRGEITADGKTNTQSASEWAEEYENSLRTSASASQGQEGDWADEFVGVGAGAVGGTGTNSQESERKEEFWQKLNEEWEKLAQEDSPVHPWLSDTSPSKLNEPYQFAEENAFKELEDPFEEGKKKLIEGDIPSAALLFEAAVLKHSEDPESWTYLGTTQSLNEQDVLSIAALNKCLELQPNNLVALMSLATSLTNESYHLQASNVLKRWLKYNDKYSHLITQDVGDTLPSTSSILPRAELEGVQRLFMQAARQNPPEAVDPDVQCGLGILFSLSSDFEKAVDCFQSALGANPDNPLLWNRLGATLANGGKSSDSIAAYRRALELSPGYIRTRFNLGIACVNLGAYREAAEHFLTSLNMQANGKTSETSTQKSVKMSDSIWSSLRTSLHLLGMTPLTKFVDSRDLEGLIREFNLQS